MTFRSDFSSADRSGRPAVSARTRRIRVRLLPWLLCAVGLLPLPALAWGWPAHRLIADVAETRMTASARAEVDRLLATEPGSTLSSISTWADEFRSPTTASWHYVNLPRDAGCRYESGRSCIQGMCVVGAVERQIERLQSGVSDADRLKALKYVVHLVADVHQPLHAGFADDRGGNKFQVQAYGRGTNLHAVWDSALVEYWPGGHGALRAAVESQAAVGYATSAPAKWAEESCTIVSENGFYPDRHRIDEDYAARWRPTLVLQLAKASARLAAVLNQALSSDR